MKYFVIADEDTVLGFRYAGVDGKAVRSAEEAREVFRRACSQRQIGIILIQDSIAQSIREEVNRVRFEAKIPLVVEIPGPEGTIKGRPTLKQLIQEAVGIRV